MTPLARKWIDALRSKKYKQCRGALRREEDGEVRYCCLGVLEKVAGVREADISGLFADSVIYRRTGLHKLHLYQRQLSGMNDAGDSFADIADYIEAALKKANSRETERSETISETI